MLPNIIAVMFPHINTPLCHPPMFLPYCSSPHLWQVCCYSLPRLGQNMSPFVIAQASLSRCSAHIALFATPVASLSRPFAVLNVDRHRPKTSLPRCSSNLAFFATLMARLLLLFAMPVTNHFPSPNQTINIPLDVSPSLFFATLMARPLLLFAMPVTNHFPLPIAKSNHQHPFRCFSLVVLCHTCGESDFAPQSSLLRRYLFPHPMIMADY